MEPGRDVFFRYRFLPSPGYDYLSPSVAELTGYPVEAFLADPQLFSTVVHPDDRELLTLASGDAGGSSTTRWVRKDGTVIWVQQQSVAITGGSVVACAGWGGSRYVAVRVRADSRGWRRVRA